MNLNEEINRLRAEGSRPEAKGLLILKLQQRKENKTMKLIRKLTIPVALAACLAVAGLLMIPRTALASPSTVAKAIRSVQDYIISSFTILDGKRTLSSKTTVVNGKLSRQFYDATGKPIREGKINELEGIMFELAIGSDANGSKRVRTIKGGPGADAHVVQGHQIAAPGEQNIEVKATKGPDGKIVKHYFVNGKEVKELPAGMKERGELKIGAGNKEVQGLQIEVGSAERAGGGVRGGFMVVNGDDNGDVTSFASGQTTADYLVKLLENESRWDIERGVTFGGQILDKFTLKGPESPIELFVDPSTSLPKVLRFVGPRDGIGPQVEDEYVYGPVPSSKK